MPTPAVLATFELAAAALATFLPLKLTRKSVWLPLKLPLLPKALSWQVWPRELEQTAFAEVEGAEKSCPLLFKRGVLTFWNTLPSATTIPPASMSKA